jgi:hypothetical protein
MKISNDKFKKIIQNNNEPTNNDKNNENIIKNTNENNDIKKIKQNLLWSNSQFNNKKINTYENLFNKKTFDKYLPIRDQLAIEKKNPNAGIILPDLKNINNTNNFKNYNNINIKSSQNMYLRSVSTDKAKLQQNTNNVTNDTSAFTHSSKKYFTPTGFGTQNYTEDVSKYRMGLLSAGSSSNNNIIIPIIPMRRPVSNFNFGGGQLWNNLESNNMTHKNISNLNNINALDKAIYDEKKNINNNIQNLSNNTRKEGEENHPDIFPKKELPINHSNKNYNIYNKPNYVARNKSYQNKDLKKQFEPFSMENNMNINNMYLGMDKMITKLHKIKIEKGMMNSGIMNSLNKKFNNDYQTQIKQFKKSSLSIMFNQQNNNKNGKTINMNENNDKNKLRSHSFNNRNNNNNGYS